MPNRLHLLDIVIMHLEAARVRRAQINDLTSLNDRTIVGHLDGALHTARALRRIELGLDRQGAA